MNPLSNNVGAYITSLMALDPTRVGAGVGGGATQQNGPGFDRTSVRNLHLSGKLQVAVSSALVSGHTAQVAIALQDSADDVTYADIASASGVSDVLTGLGGAPTVRTVAQLNVDLIGVRQYMRARVTPAMSHSGTDVVALAAIWALGGGDELPEAAQGAGS